MRWTVSDKLILLGGCMFSTYMLSSAFSKEASIIWILITLAVLLLTELRKDAMTAYLLCAALIITSLFVPPLLTAAPAVAYSLYSAFKKPEKAEPYLSIFIMLALIAEELILTCGNAGYILFFFTLLAVYHAVKTSSHKKSEHSLIDRYDNAREDFINTKRLGEEIMKNADNEVYLARLKERNRIAREIHDNVGHMITRVIVQVQALSIINKDPKVSEQLASVSETLDLAMTGIRKSVHELHDDSIDLSLAIHEIAGTLPQSFDTDITTSIDSPADNNTKSVILGIIKEAVTNISKYSKGDKVRIEVIENNTFWRVRVWDNGSNPERELLLTDEYFSSGGLGLTNIATRAKSLGGRASLISNAEGFEIITTLPKPEVKKT